jgi:hypothetical protein
MNLVAEFIKIKPRGFYFHEQFFPNIEEIITWMKQNFYTEGYQRYVAKAKLPIILEQKPVVAEPPRRALRERSQCTSFSHHHHLISPCSTCQGRSWK